MEETLEEKVPIQVKVSDDDQGGIRRRLRDRDLLRKRKAEAEERATNQWVYGAESRKRARREPVSTQRKKGRPRKNVTVEQEHPEHTESQETTKLETPTPQEETVTDSAPAPAPTQEGPASAPTVSPAPYLASAPAPIPSAAPTQISAPVSAQVSPPVSVTAQIPVQVSAAAPTLPQIPAMLPAPIALPSSYVSPEVKPTGEVPHGVLIEDLGPDEEEDKLLPQEELIIDQDGVEEVSAGVAETIKGFSDSVLVSPQPDVLPGNMI
ncbi:calphotin isoform X3 [Trichomycterus rosablanca]|uniref:calphotin isoform X3 n=1 Tax=Trichomycterus rosablanca TaxID=2290929 RepID=UPI002F351C9A